ncbi:MFS transporter [Sphingobium chlorophenolicum]|uniref:MFS transporter n=1 Tax=Sphingobium chlorophenolicum TaxID=46429 RepID=UPI00031119AA|nr:MFS transporter [Sphingobium chlorophenolicum]
MPLLGAFEPRRGVFILVGAPGILIGLTVLLFVKDPPRIGIGDLGLAKLPVLPFLRANAGFLAPTILFCSMITLTSYTIYAWTPVHMLRSFGRPAAEVGMTVGCIFVVTGYLGCLFGAWIMGRGREGFVLSGPVVRDHADFPSHARTSAGAIAGCVQPVSQCDRRLRADGDGRADHLRLRIEQCGDSAAHHLRHGHDHLRHGRSDCASACSAHR